MAQLRQHARGSRRNRHFRMVWSCKGGKAAVLVPTRRFATQDGCGKTAADVFLDALICRVDTSDTLLQVWIQGVWCWRDERGVPGRVPAGFASMCLCLPNVLPAWIANGEECRAPDLPAE
jgi:hypothetical protein